jgi:hypothetical protein
MDFEKRGKWLNVLPLGVGQYQNYQPGKAFWFFAGESLLLGTVMTSAILSAGDKENKKLQKIELYSFLTFLLVYSWGTYDAFINYEKADQYIIKQMEKKLSLIPVLEDKGASLNMVMRF